MNTEHIDDANLANELLKILKEAFKNDTKPLGSYWRTLAVLAIMLSQISEREEEGSTDGWLNYFNQIVKVVQNPIPDRKSLSRLPATTKRPWFGWRLFTERK